jgi:hypothetical protein
MSNLNRLFTLTPRLIIIVLGLLTSLAVNAQTYFYSSMAREYEVTFQSVFVTSQLRLDQVSRLSEKEQMALVRREIAPIADFLFGPLVTRHLGAPQRTQKINVVWSGAREVDGRLELPYEYAGTWILSKSIATQGEFTIPVPVNTDPLYTPGWRGCTDSQREHQTPTFYWYFWDPQRPACDHVQDNHYREVTVHVGRQTENQARTAPEYERLFREIRTNEARSSRELRITIAFGYLKDPETFAPDLDDDPGMAEYRHFINLMRAQWGSVLSESLIVQGEYRSAVNAELAIGRRFTGELNGSKVVVNVVTSAGIDQMELFAKSFAHDHDGVFAWFGHSRVGSGFDADRFGMMLARDPHYYSVTPEYQIVYWGGCNSYSYYTLPFFSFKAQASEGKDPKGTKGLDIIANGLPSYFGLGADNAQTVVDQFLHWPERRTYQRMVNQIELSARQYGWSVFAVVLGDEDNGS